MDIAQQSETRHDFAPIFLFAFTLFVSATLMFVLQPMFGKVLLPLLGGAASVWNTCMVFYQSILFLGYLYAHYLANHFSQSRQLLIHGLLLLLTLSFLPIGMPENSPPPTESNPTLWLLTMLLMSIGLPFFVLSTTSPLLQKWFSRLGHETSNDPYYLSIASNAGSLIALLSYPFLLEPQIGLTDQQRFWSVGFLVLCAFISCCMIVLRRHNHHDSMERSTQTASAAVPGLKLKLYWLALAFVPSSLLLGTTNYISIDIASVPLLWVIPLALYLVSFIIVFSKYNDAVHKWMLLLQPWVVAPFLIYLFSTQKLESFSIELVLHLLVFFISIMVCHGELAKKRPAAKYLTHYYLIMSFGGMLGGIFNSFIAPLVFNGIYEYPLMIIIGLLLNPTNKTKRLSLQEKWWKKVFIAYLFFFATILYINYEQFSEELILGLLIITVLANFFVFHKNMLYLALYSMIIVSCATPNHQHNHQILHQSRNFYGVLSIKKDADITISAQQVTTHTLYSGSTEHGAQLITNDTFQCTPVSYYNRQGPLGQLFHQYDPINANWQIGIVGLGAGELATYAKETQQWNFFELNPAVIDIATNPAYFTYLSDCVKKYKIFPGDARLTLEQEANHGYDLLVIDAFTSDSIPTHLLTKEAIDLYFSKLKPYGILAFHISNRHLAVKKVLADHAQNMELIVLLQEYRPAKKNPLVYKSDWAVLARNAQALQPLLEAQSAAWKKIEADPNMQTWTDDFTSLVSIWK
jgi:spermidine synthase